MMLPIRYTYLFGSGLFFLPWFLIYSKRKDLRKLLIFDSLLFSVLGLFLEFFFWTKDWWHPYTITNTRIGLEDILLGFGSGGVASCLYLFIFHQKLTTSNLISKKRLNILFLIIISGITFFFILVYIVKMSSFLATIINGFIVCIILMFFNRTLIKTALINSILLVVLVVPVFQLMILMTSGFIEKTWMLNNLIGIRILGVPLEDYVFYFISGIGCFLVYPFLFENVKLSKIKKIPFKEKTPYFPYKNVIRSECVERNN
jgi:hypothetical protein